MKNQLELDELNRGRAAEDLGNCYCVEASAGTGKTSLLLGRILSVLRNKKSTIERIAAITFTEKAALELKLRLRESLEEEMVSSPADLARDWRDALEGLESARISTIHSFCASLLRERPVEAGVDPYFETLDELEAELLFEEVWERWLSLEAENIGSALRRPLFLGIAPGQLRKAAREIYRHRDLQALPADEVGEEEIEMHVQFLAREVDRLLQIAEEHCIHLEDRAFLQIKSLKGKVDGAQELRGLEREYALLHFPRINARAGNKNNWRPKEICGECKAILADLQAKVESMRRRLGEAVMAEVLEALGGFLSVLEAEKVSRGVLDFDDLLLKTRNLLRDNPRARGAFQNRFDYILVDEFQDTDPLQAEIIFFLAEEKPIARDWREVKLKPGKLFIVGDPKQSIYRFRRADIEVYEEAKGVLGSDRIVPIYRNFRSRPRLIHWINSCHEKLIQRSEDGEYQPAYQPLEASLDEEGGEPRVTVIRDSAAGEKKDIEEARLAEARYLARYIEGLISSGWAAGDIAVLMPQTTQVELFEEAMEEVGIQCRAERGRGFFRRGEIRDMARLLLALERPGDPLAVIAALRTAYLGFSDEELAWYRSRGGRFNYLDKGEPGSLGEEGEHFSNAFAWLKSYHMVKETLPISELILRMIDDLGARELCLLHPRGEEGVFNLEKLVELARHFEMVERAGFRKFVFWLRDRVEGRVEEVEAGIPDDEGAAVKVMTVHKAKGLEFPVVMLANLGGGRKGERDIIADHRRGIYHLSLDIEGVRIATPSYEEAREREQHREEAERRRLFYVATTRARERLVIVDFRSGLRRGDFQKFLDELEEPFEMMRAEGIMEELSEPDLALVGAEEGARLPVPFFLEEKFNGSTPTLKVTLPLRERGRTYGQRFIHRAASEGNIVAEVGEGRGMHGRVVGILYHRLMKEVRLDEYAGGGGKILRRIAGPAVKEVAEEVCRLVDNTLNSPILERARKARRVFREVPFTYLQDENLSEGVIDLLIEEEDGLVIVDYKSDHLRDGELQEKVNLYREQMERYRFAAERITGKKVKEVVLLFASLPVEASL
jgi:ATP-dependent helicase/nuclease subunit A